MTTEANAQRLVKFPGTLSADIVVDVLTGTIVERTIDPASYEPELDAERCYVTDDPASPADCDAAEEVIYGNGPAFDGAPDWELGPARPHPLIGRIVKPTPGILSFGDHRTGHIAEVYDADTLRPIAEVEWDLPEDDWPSGHYPLGHLTEVGDDL